jgi:hypothetical protein
LKIEEVLKRRGSTYNGYPVSPEYFGAFSKDHFVDILKTRNIDIISETHRLQNQNLTKRRKNDNHLVNILKKRNMYITGGETNRLQNQIIENDIYMKILKIKATIRSR